MKNIFSVIAIGILMISCNNKAKQISDQIKVGTTIDLSDYDLLSVNGKQIQGDKLILIDFWATWCGPCIASFPHLEKVQDSYGNTLQIIAVSDEKVETVEGFLKKRDFDLTFMSDPEKSLHKKFDIKSIPISCLLSENGKFLWAGSSENLEYVLKKYWESGNISDFDLTELNRPYYDAKTIEKIEKASNHKFLIQEAENPERYIVRNQKLDSEPVNIEYISATLTEIIVDFFNVDRKYIVNNRPELDTLLLDIKAKNENISYGQAKENILNTIMKSYDFEIQEKTKQADIYVLQVIDEAKLKKYIETVEGGGQAQVKDETIEITRLSLEQLASYFQKKLDPYIQYKGTDNSKFNFTIQYFETISDLESSLKEIGLSLEKTEGVVEIITIK
ncbi:TlpA family protein disulfide reductase [Portibacter marinus]|uniref:TlpA family protein disulfide reductase n=1 Tax=Portibacter marinus TaxID=2898660 RepID=UPI001F32557C|nr:TlpA disulfide reductase family protein [Portibacter marinus]